MAPSRSKGVTKAAVAAACRQWKVGDLVLAKVKGFPAWPAMVSEPEKWGYPADWKKVLVYFFGTQQIAFCNPTDVEAFTEEKKESLLTKLHGKGADFVRALQEIIDSYEKLKKQDQVINCTFSAEVAATNKSMESLSSSGLKDEAAVESCLKTSYSTRAKNDSSFPIEGALVVRQKDPLRDGEMPSEEPTGSLMVMDSPLAPTYSSRRKNEGLQSRNSVEQNRAASARRSRSSSRVSSCKFHNFMLLPCNGGNSARNVTGYLLRDKSVRSNNRIRNSPDVSEGHNTDSPAFVSNGRIEDSSSELVTGDSDALSFNEGSTVESGCKCLQAELVVECSEGDVELSQRLDFQTKVAVIKKKRKPNRKRVSNDTTELSRRLGNEVGLENEVHKTELTHKREKEADLEIEVHKTRHCPLNDLDKYNERYSKKDGDEHLPLVKRARVRMGRSSPEKEQDILTRTEEKSTEIPNSFSGWRCKSLDCEEGSPADKNPLVKHRADDSSPTQCPVNKSDLCQVKTDKLFGCSVDREATLPPSKRLRRALEAMSANAAEDGRTSSEAASTMKTSINESCFLSSGDCSSLSMDSKSGSEFGNGASQDCTSYFSICVNPPLAGKSANFSEVATCNKTVRVTNNKKHEYCKDVLLAIGSADGNVLSSSSMCAHASDNVVIGLSPNRDGKEDCLECNQASVGLMLPSNEDRKMKSFESIKPCKELDPSKLSKTSLVGNDSLHNETSLLLHSGEGGSSEATKLWEHALDEKNQRNGMCEVVKESKQTPKDSNATPSPTLEKVVMDAAQGPHLSPSVAVCEDQLGMMVDEYGSNSSFPLPGFHMPPMLKDEDGGNDSDGESFEAVTPEHNSEKPEELEGIPTPAIEKYRHNLKDVDGELEMEDVSPSSGAEVSSTGTVAGVKAAPPLPEDVPVLFPLLPMYPPPPAPPPPPFPPSAMPDHITRYLDSKLYMDAHNIKDNCQESMAQQSVATGINAAISDVVHDHAPENRDIKLHTPDSSNSRSFSCPPLSHQPIRAVNNLKRADGAFHNKAFHLRPPRPAPTNQFSYFQVDQQVRSRREIPPPSYPNRTYFLQNTKNGNFFSNHDSMKVIPRDIGKSWRFPTPSFSAQYYRDNSRVSWPPFPFGAPPGEPAVPNHRWPLYPQAMNHIEMIPHRPPFGGPIRVGHRASTFRRPI